MAISGWHINFDIIIRWLHVIAGITWIGHLYFFNWVNANFQTVLEKEYKKSVNPKLIGRALFFFRWGAMITFIAGLILFTEIYMYQDGKGFGPSAAFRLGGQLTDRAIWILIGGALATIMWFNVWFIIWPAQKKILPAIRDGVAPDAALVKRATLASKINTYLSAPMLFGMLAPNHYPAIRPAGKGLLTLGIFAAIALLTIWVLYKAAPKVGKDFEQK
jgi:uncharacterized membrane protein